MSLSYILLFLFQVWHGFWDYSVRLVRIRSSGISTFFSIHFKARSFYSRSHSTQRREIWWRRVRPIRQSQLPSVRLEVVPQWLATRLFNRSSYNISYILFYFIAVLLSFFMLCYVYQKEMFNFYLLDDNYFIRYYYLLI